jgi:hypothetical protein
MYDALGAHLKELKAVGKWIEPSQSTAKRILLLLELSRRPLLWAELSGALALRQREGRLACRWLAANGYVVANVDSSGRDDEAAAAPEIWSLGEKGMAWLRNRSGLAIPKRPQSH